MPTITPTARASIGGSPEDFRQPRASVTASTGMGLPSLKEVKAEGSAPGLESPKNGHSDTKEDTNAGAVTLSPQLTALARKQQRLQQEIQAQREREAAFAAKEGDYIPKSAFKAKMQENASEALKDLGLDYEELTNLLLSQQQGQDPVKDLRAEIQQIKAAQEESVSKNFEAIKTQYAQAIESLVSGDESYITIREEGRQDAVLQHILDTFKDSGKTLSVEEASKDIEDFLVADAEKKLSLTKIKAKQAPKPEVPPEKTLPPPRSGTRTLTQQVDTAPTRTYNQFQHLSMRERIEQSIARARK